MDDRLIRLWRDPFDGFNLTDKEKETARLYAFGYSEQEICDLQKVHRSTIQQRLRSARQKIGLQKHRQLTRRWFELFEAVLFNLQIK